MAMGGAEMQAAGAVKVQAYGQAGLVGLNERAGFFDLQMLATRDVATLDNGSALVGAGIWAGGQQERAADGEKAWIHRVDVGPRAALDLPVGNARMTVALDWRQRIDGAAAPASGAALTVSTGF
jgi:hypothetical protein